MDRPAERPLAPTTADPSISQTAAIIGANIAGRKSNGGKARAPIAPAPKAIARRRQSQARMTLWASAPIKFPSRDRIKSVESKGWRPGSKVRKSGNLFSSEPCGKLKL